jgi:hypothetical protein
MLGARHPVDFRPDPISELEAATDLGGREFRVGVPLQEHYILNFHGLNDRCVE